MLRSRHVRDFRHSTGPFHTEGAVEFRAHWTEHGRAGELHENSRFVREDGAWVCLDGVIGDWLVVTAPTPQQ